MEDENLEDIVFDRLCRYLKQFGVEIIYHDTYLRFRLLIDGKPFRFQSWMSKKDVLMGVEYVEDFHMNMIRMSSIFTIFDDYIGFYAEGGKMFQVMVKVQQCLDAIKADNYEEMLLKMDLMGI